MKVPNSPAPSEPVFFLDTAAFLEGANLVPSRCVATPQVVAEVRPGGASGRRLEQWLAAGLAVAEGTPEAWRRVEGVAEAAGNRARLSEADVSILALALARRGEGTLLSDDYTVLDVARRLGIEARPVTKAGIAGTKDWGARCAGCGRTFPVEAVARPCPVCGADVRLRPRR